MTNVLLIILMIFTATSSFASPVKMEEVDLEARLRTEFRGFDGAGPSDQEIGGLNRIRLFPKFKFSSQIKYSRFVLGPQFEKTYGENNTGSGVTHDNVTFREGYFHWKKDSFELTLGRAPLHFGQGLLVGERNWINQGQSFDLVRFDFDYFLATAKSSFFYARINESADLSTTDDESHFLGFYHFWSGAGLVPDLEFGLFYLDLEESTGVDLLTGTIYLHQKGETISFGTEGVIQSGSRIKEGYAVKLNGEWHFNQDIDLLAKFSQAGNDFDPLFQNVHGWFGLVDYLGRRNIRDVSLGARYTNFEFKGHLLSKVSGPNVWGIQPQARVGATPLAQMNASDSIGSALDLLFHTNVTTDLKLDIGAGAFLASSEAEKAGLKDNHFLYFQILFK